EAGWAVLRAGMSPGRVPPVLAGDDDEPFSAWLDLPGD
uniref:Prevent-host-death protein n=1 Tax=Plectus sambesii TaxID=2011161 RepID=A0A914W8H2_9BILA